MIILQPGPNPGLTNTEYHSETAHLSSSNFKMLLSNPEQFYQEKILGNKPPEGKQAHLVLGSYVHSMVLEPDQVAKEYAFFDGWRKAGPDFKAFLEQNPGKTIISKPQKATGESLARAVNANPTALKLLTGGTAEMSYASRILDVPVKMRADSINVSKGYIVDLKTTSQPTDTDIFKATIQDFRYDLSAALYCQIAHEVYGKVFDFYFIVISKADLGCQVYKASTDTLSKGGADLLKALVLYKKCLKSGIWSLTQPKNCDSLEEIVEV
jgi:hypothetical protein